MDERKFDFYRELSTAGGKLLTAAEYTPEGRKHYDELYDMVVDLADMLHKERRAGRSEHGEG